MIQLIPQDHGMVLLPERAALFAGRLQLFTHILFTKLTEDLILKAGVKDDDSRLVANAKIAYTATVVSVKLGLSIGYCLGIIKYIGSKIG